MNNFYFRAVGHALDNGFHCVCHRLRHPWAKRDFFDGGDVKIHGLCISELGFTLVNDSKFPFVLKDATFNEHFQFERLGYFTPDVKDSAPGKLVFNRTISLKDTWAKPGQK